MEHLTEARLEGAAKKQLEERVSRLRVKHVFDQSGDNAMLLDRLLISGGGNLKQPPVAARKALTICKSPSADMRQLCAACEQDPALTQALLKHANSTYYARPGQQPVAAIRAAVDRVGLRGVHSVLLEITTSGLLSQPGPEYSALMEEVWHHTGRTAHIARRIARLFGVDPELGFSITLLHDAGKLVVFDVIAGMRVALRRSPRLGAPFLHEVLDVLAPPIGGLLALDWGLGVEPASAIAGQHKEGVSAVGGALGDVIFVADKVDTHRMAGEPVDPVALANVSGRVAAEELAELIELAPDDSVAV